MVSPSNTEVQAEHVVKLLREQTELALAYEHAFNYGSPRNLTEAHKAWLEKVDDTADYLTKEGLMGDDDGG